MQKWNSAQCINVRQACWQDYMGSYTIEEKGGRNASTKHIPVEGEKIQQKGERIAKIIKMIKK